MTKKLRETIKCHILEFLGIFILNTISAIAASTKLHEVVHHNKRNQISLAESSLLFFLTTTFAPISGGYFNPAITIPLMITRDISVKKGLGYIAMHLTGSISSCLFYKSLHLNFKISRVFGIAAPYPVLNSTYFDVKAGFVLEAISTLFLTLGFYTALRNRFTAKQFGLTISMLYLLGGMMAGNVTGGSLNPARSFGFDLFYGGFLDGFWRRGAWVMYLGPLVGAQVGAFLGNNFFNERVNVLGIEYEENNNLEVSDSDLDVSFGMG